jgi:mannose-6-phosphate isomerase-like protein (cupin superfamily)
MAGALASALFRRQRFWPAIENGIWLPIHSGSTMKIIRSKSFTAERAWAALDIANMNGITTRLHWTDQPYKWHINDGQEVFVVLDGQVQMRYREEGEAQVLLEVGDIFYASVGTEHVAHPVGPARILVIESEGSV